MQHLNRASDFVSLVIIVIALLVGGCCLYVGIIHLLWLSPLALICGVGVALSGYVAFGTMNLTGLGGIVARLGALAGAIAYPVYWLI